MIPRIHSGARTFAVWGTCGLGLVLPISPALANVMSLLIIVGWALSGHWAEKLSVLRHSRAAQTVGVFFVFLLLGTLYGNSNFNEDLHYLTKYASLLMVPILLSLQLSSREKWRALVGFCVAMIITLLISCLIWFKCFPIGLIKDIDPSNPVVFKLHITHGFFMALTSYILYFSAKQYKGAISLSLNAFALLALINVLFMVKGRTGQAVCLVLLVYLFCIRFPRTGLLFGIVITILITVGAYSTSTAFKERTDIAIYEATHWQAKKGDASSIGTRLDYYSTSLAIIKQNPLLGVGTGGFPHAYSQQIEGTAMAPSNNPHNQYLLITAQLGLAGLLAMLAMYAACWQRARSMPPPFAHLAIGVLLAYLIGNLFNSFMLDFSERLLFAWAIGLLLSSHQNEWPTSPNKITLTRPTP